MSQLEQLQVNYDRVAKERDDFAGQVSTLSSQRLQAELDQIALNRDAKEEVKSLTGDLTKEISRLSEHCPIEKPIRRSKEALEVNKDILESQEGTLSIQLNDESYAIIQQSGETGNANLRLREHQDSITRQQEIGQIQEELEDVKIQRSEIRNDQGRKVYEVDAPRRMNIKPQAMQQYLPSQSQNFVDS
ncbi:7392_t:CDS:2 [Acaulospora morrowiae]|uniref:7392_t:CDS:1 n=1 Tax=Acaulospora morrowiae TaxID=94023 RepID=A0A9N9N778_9GLOM|nr:7392_t:CDS:2 [Acaulospora morrowiae]